MILETLACFKGVVAIVVPQLRIGFELFTGNPSHIGKTQKPHGDTNEGHPDELLFGKKFDCGYDTTEVGLQHDDVGPTLVIADHQIPLVCGQLVSFRPRDLEVRQPQRFIHPAVVAGPGAVDPVKVLVEPRSTACGQQWPDEHLQKQRRTDNDGIRCQKN